MPDFSRNYLTNKYACPVGPSFRKKANIDNDRSQIFDRKNEIGRGIEKEWKRIFRLRVKF